MFTKKLYALLITLFFALNNLIFSQSLVLPRVSPGAVVTQKIGVSSITVTYSRPAVNGRVIWGGVVPYNLVWRAGANENTTIEFSDDVYINGTILPAGKYGFHIIPTQEEWTIIFSKHNDSWGSFFYDPEYDQLRLNVKVEKIDMVERLTYGFDNITKNSATLFLDWEMIRLPFRVKFDVTEITLDSIRGQLRGIAGFGWEAPMQAANFCLQNKINYEEALNWINLSISRNENLSNLIIKGFLLKEMKKLSQLSTVTDQMQIHLEYSGEYELITYGRFLIFQNNFDEALKVFEGAVVEFPNSWNAIVNLAKVFEKKNDYDDALEYYKRALELAPKNQKAKIEKSIEIIKSKNN